MTHAGDIIGDLENEDEDDPLRLEEEDDEEEGEVMIDEAPRKKKGKDEYDFRTDFKLPA